MPELVVVGRINQASTNPETLRIRIDRGTPLGNPYTMHSGVSREQAIKRYTRYLKSKYRERGSQVQIKIDQLVNIINKGHKIELICWCSPLPCHGDIIKEFIIRILEEGIQTKY